MIKVNKQEKIKMTLAKSSRFVHTYCDNSVLAPIPKVNVNVSSLPVKPPSEITLTIEWDE